MGEQKEWKWDETQLKDSNNTPLKVEDVKQLLITRGEKKQNLKEKKCEMIEFLKEKYDVSLNEPLKDLTNKELLAELKLRGLNDIPAKKSILIQRINGEIDASPPKKKMKRAKKSKTNNKVFVAVYTPAATAENDAIVILGAYKSERRAYEKTMDRLTDDIEEYYDDKQDKMDKAMKKFDKIDEAKYEDRFEELQDVISKAFDGKEEDAPYGDIQETVFYDWHFYEIMCTNLCSSDFLNLD